MFATKRGKLRRKILKRCEDNSSEDAVHSVLKQLEIQQLENLAAALESRGGDRVSCTTISKKQHPSRIQGNWKDLVVLFCKAYRWPDVNKMTRLKRTPNCGYSDWYSGKERTKNESHGNNICINPYHLARCENIENCPPYLDLDVPHRNTVFPGRIDYVRTPLETETGDNFVNQAPEVDMSDSNRLEENWCTLAYWETRNRVGNLFPVNSQAINFFNDLPQGDGMCISELKSHPESSKTKDGIGYGITLALEEILEDGSRNICNLNQCISSESPPLLLEDIISSQSTPQPAFNNRAYSNNNNEPNIFSTQRKVNKAIWLFNRSEKPVFLHSPTLDVTPREASVHKILPGSCIRAFDYDVAKKLREESKFTRFSRKSGPYTSTSITISFVKGWGQKYKRQCVTLCPCWLEVLINLGNNDYNKSNLLMRSNPDVVYR